MIAPGPVFKTCCRCRLQQPIKAFGQSSREADGMRPECKACRRVAYRAAAPAHRAKQTAYYHANREARREAQALYNQDHASEIAAKARARTATLTNADSVARADQRRRWAQENREKVAADNRAWRERNREHVRQKERARTVAGAAERRAYERQRRQTRPEWEKAKKHARRARVRDALGSFTPEQWSALYALFNGRCAACQQESKLTADHVVPLAKGGANDIGNIQPLCAPCNSSKGTTTIDYRSARIRELIAAGTWPHRWTGDEPTADVPLDAVFSDGSVQPLLIGAE